MSDQRLTIMHSVPGSWLPLTQRWLYDQVRFLSEFVVSHVACDRLEHADSCPGPAVHEAGPVPAWRRALRRRSRPALASLLRTHGVELLHSHFAPEGWRNLAVARRLGIPHVVSFYGYDVNQLPRAHPRWRHRYLRLFDAVDRVLCEGEHMAHRIMDLGCPAGKIHVQRLGVDLASIPFRPRTWSGTKPLRVLLASAFREKKGLPDAIEALAAVAEDTPLTVTLAGDAGNDPASRAEKARIDAALDDTGLRQRTRCLGFVPHDVLLREAYEHHVHVAASRTAADGDTEGGAPVTLALFAATGLPIVSTHHADIPSVIQAGKTGYLARPGDVSDLTDQIRRVVARSGRWLPMLMAGRRWMEEQFDATHQGALLAETYVRLVTGGLPLPPARDTAPSTGRRAA